MEQWSGFIESVNKPQSIEDTEINTKQVKTHLIKTEVKLRSSEVIISIVFQIMMFIRSLSEETLDDQTRTSLTNLKDFEKTTALKRENLKSVNAL